MQFANALVGLFENFEEQSGYTFTSFCVNEQPNTTISTQPYMSQYQATLDNNVYKYLYDPTLNFDFRFFQRLSRFTYDERDKPWITLIFNTDEVNPVNGFLSNKYNGYRLTENSFHISEVRRAMIPIKVVFVSNSLQYLYTFLENMIQWWDRIVNFEYEQSISYSNSDVVHYDLVGQALKITPQDLNKLDTSRRGSLASLAYSFDLAYWDVKTPETGYILKEIGLQIKVVDNLTNLNVHHIFNVEIT